MCENIRVPQPPWGFVAIVSSELPFGGSGLKLDSLGGGGELVYAGPIVAKLGNFFSSICELRAIFFVSSYRM